MTAAAVVIGLGMAAQPFLTAITTAFRQQTQGESDVADRLGSLWLTPYAAESPPADGGQATRLALPLAADSLNRLYYDRHVKIWCAPNWKYWGEHGNGQVLASNRLHGKLAIHQHWPAVKRAIQSQIDAVARTSVDAVHFYLIAPLHDPFASGALLDMAYLLHHFAGEAQHGQSIRRVFGLLVAPGVIGDPLLKPAHDDDQERSQLEKVRNAIYHAALRELNFAGSVPSFYRAHHPDFMMLDCENTWPFTTGDCFMVGGRIEKGMAASDQFAADRRPTAYDHEQLVNDCAQFVARHTLSALFDVLPRSQAGRPLVTSFGLHLETERHSGETRYQAVVNDLAEWLHGERAAPFPLALESIVSQLRQDYATLSLRRTKANSTENAYYGAKARVGLLQTAPTSSSPQGAYLVRFDAQARQLLEEQYTDGMFALDELISEWGAISAEAAQQFAQKYTLDGAESPLAALHRQPGISLMTLQSWYTQLFDQLAVDYAATKRAVDDQERATAVQQRALRDSLAQTRQVDVRVMSAFSGLVIVMVVSFGVMVSMIGFPSEGVAVALVAGLLGIGLARRHLHERKERAEQGLLQSAQALLETYERLAELRFQGQFQYQALTQLRQAAQKGVRLDSEPTQRPASLIEMAAELFNSPTHAHPDSRPTREVLAIGEDEWAAYAPLLLADCWACSDRRALERTLLRFILKHNLLNQDDQDDLSLIQVTTDALAQTQLLLNIVPEQIDEADRNRQYQIAGLIEWETVRNPPRFSQFVEEQRIQSVPIVVQSSIVTHSGSARANASALAQPLGDSKERAVLSILWRTHIPLHALRQRGAEHYRQAIRYDAGDQTFVKRAWLHPTRLGVASIPFDDELSLAQRSFPAIGMAVTVLLIHLKAARLSEYANELGVRYSPTSGDTPNADELCGALQDPRNRGILNELVDVERVNPYVLEADVEHILSRLPHPKASELNADWQEWIVGWLRVECTQHRSRLRREPIHAASNPRLALIRHLIDTLAPESVLPIQSEDSLERADRI